MSMKQKILIKIALMSLLTSAAIIIIVLFNFRQYAINATTERAEVISELIKNGLVSYMQNGTMEKRDVFLNNMSHTKDVDRLWVARGEAVSKQYGEPLKNEIPRDEIDKKVLKSGQKYIKLDEKLNSAILRVSVPYLANGDDTADCTKCHQVNQGDVLGVISMEIDIMPIREEGIATIAKIILTALIAIFIVIILTNRLLDPYLELFESLKASIKKASLGNFGDKIQSPLKDEAGEMVREYDYLLEKLDNTFGEIDKKLRTFVASKNYMAKDPLSDAENIVGSLARLYQFKKAIELDVTKEDIYNRLAYVFENYFNIKRFVISEINSQTDEFEVVLKHSDSVYCTKILGSDSSGCRARRTGVSVVSDDFPKICTYFGEFNEKHLCIPINIGSKVGMIIHITTDSKEEFEQIKKHTELIKSYANEASPVIESKKLMKMLKDSSLKDNMTGLYNRRFLDEYVDKIKPNAIRQKINIGILMIDMDHFKMVNDSYGHDVGDMVLKELATILSESVRSADLVIRYGGEEFIVLLMSVESEEKAIEVAEKLRTKVQNKEIEIGSGKYLRKTISVGVSMFPSDTDSIWQSIKYADIALYKAKNLGRNKVVRFERSMWEESVNF